MASCCYQQRAAAARWSLPGHIEAPVFHLPALLLVRFSIHSGGCRSPISSGIR